MNGRIWCGALLVVLAGAVASGQREPNASQNLALIGGTLIDGLGGVTTDSVVLIRGERIDGIGTVATLSVPPGFERVSTEGMTVLPGLWDPHVHLMYGGYPNGQAWLQKYATQLKSTIMPASAEQFLMAGVTTVRDLIAPTDAILEVRRRVASGQLPGPTIFASGNALSKAAPGAASGATNFARTDITDITGEADARIQAKKLLDAGVDVIKVINAAKWSVAELKAAVGEAHARGLTVTSHARDDADIRANLAAGVDEMQHIGTSGDEYPADIIMLIRERVKAGPTLRWSPTVGPTVNAAQIDAVPEYLDDPATVRGFPPGIIADLRGAIAERRARRRDAGPDRIAQVARDTKVVMRKFQQLRELGVEFVFGSDEGTFGATATDATWMEAEAWVNQLGFDPMTVIQKMTSQPARMVGADRDSGSVSVGKYADLMAVRGNPLRHISALGEPSLVLKRGRRFK